MEPCIEKSILKWNDYWPFAGFKCTNCEGSTNKGEDLTQICKTEFKKDGSPSKHTFTFICRNCE